MAWISLPLGPAKSPWPAGEAMALKPGTGYPSCRLSLVMTKGFRLARFRMFAPELAFARLSSSKYTA